MERNVEFRIKNCKEVQRLKFNAYSRGAKSKKAEFVLLKKRKNIFEQVQK